jgi:hypothetical protein
LCSNIFITISKAKTMKNILFVFFCLFFLGTTSCIKDKSQSQETTVTVVDVDGKPIKERLVNIFVNSQRFFGFFQGNQQAFATGFTDANGQVVLRYKLDLSETPTQFVMAIAQDDESVRALNIVTHQGFSSTSGTSKTSGTIVMDSMTTFTMRFKTDRTDVQALSVQAGTESIIFTSTGTSIISRTFLGSFAQTATPRLDTVLTTKVYAKAPFNISASMSFKTNPFNINKGTIKFIKNQDRSGVFLQTF